MAALSQAPRYRILSAWLFTATGILFQFFFGWFPVLIAFLVGFQEYFFAKPAVYVGFRNFQDVVADPLTYTAFVNTFHYAILSIGITFVIPIFVSILLMEM